jgi:hypothetical protein
MRAEPSTAPGDRTGAGCPSFKQWLERTHFTAYLECRVAALTLVHQPQLAAFFADHIAEQIDPRTVFVGLQSPDGN